MNRRSRFHALLRQYGIDEFSPTIPQGIGKHLQGVVYKDDLHPVPQIENEENIVFPEHKVGKLTEEQMKQQYTEAELKLIALSFVNQKLDYSHVSGKELDIPGQFPSASNFVHFKRALATEIAKQNKELQLELGTFSVCKYPQCLNATVPTFDYCLSHLYMDDKFDKVKLIHKCRSEKGCCTPCSNSQENCSIHRLPGK